MLRFGKAGGILVWESGNLKIYGKVQKLIDRYGMDVLVDNKKAKAFVQPYRSSGNKNSFIERKMAGFIRKNRYLYIGKPEVKLICDKSVIQTADGKYIVRRYDIYRMGKYGIYTYAVLAPLGEVLEDEYESDNYTT